MMIDIFNHFMPMAYLDRLGELIPGHMVLTAFPRIRTLWDIDARLSLLDEFDGLQQVLSLANPPLELVASPDRTPELARLANDALAELCRRHADRFPAFIASLPMNNIDATLAEIDRAVTTLGARGVQVFTNVAGEPLSAEKFRPIFRRMTEHDLPVWVHPMGGMIPYFAGRIGLGFRQIFFGTPEKNPAAEDARLQHRPIDYYKQLYADTALNGDLAATRCGHAFFGTSSCLFATDAPFDAEHGRGLIRNTIKAIEALPITAGRREMIFAGNARELLKLPARSAARASA